MNTQHTDRELLELAAKAAGKDVDLGRYDEDFGFAIKDMALWWNPLHDDGDALRLAADLRLSCMTHENFSASASSLDGRAYGEAAADNPAARYVALRSAIVRAAAAIGEAMP